MSTCLRMIFANSLPAGKIYCSFSISLAMRSRSWSSSFIVSTLKSGIPSASNPGSASVSHDGTGLPAFASSFR